MTLRRLAGRIGFLAEGSAVPALPQGLPRMTFLWDGARLRTSRPARSGGREMLRATVWTVGLFGAGTAICRTFPSTWTEPLVLFALGLALLFASARTTRSTHPAPSARPAATIAAVAPKPAATPAAMPASIAAAAQVQVERTA